MLNLCIIVNSSADLTFDASIIWRGHFREMHSRTVAIVSISNKMHAVARISHAFKALILSIIHVYYMLRYMFEILGRMRPLEMHAMP